MVLYDKTNPNLNAKADGPLNLSDEEQAEAIKTIREHAALVGLLCTERSRHDYRLRAS